MNSRDAWSIASTASFQWLSGDRAVICETRRPEADRTLEILDAATAHRTPLCDPAAALNSLHSLLHEAAPLTLPYPEEISAAGTEALYTFGGDLYLLECATSTFRRITSTPEEEKCASFSPDGKRIAFVRANNLYSYDIAGGREVALTSDGSDSLLNGTVTWLYWEEVFGRHDTGYWWSDDSKSIAFFRTDESGVSVQHYVDVTPWTPRVLTQRYPKVGEKNPVVRVGMVDAGGGATTWVDFGGRTFEYVVRAQWLPDGKRLSVQTLNRPQTELDLYFAERATGRVVPILKEADSAWVNILDDFVMLPGGNEFLWGSERDGYEHLYRYALDGTLINKVTDGPWAVCAAGGEVAWLRGGIVGINKEEKLVFFTAREKSVVEKHLYSVRWDGTGLKRLSSEDGTHSITFSPTGHYYFDRFSNITTLPSLALYNATGKMVAEIATPRPELLAPLHLQYPSLFTIPARDGFPMPAQILKPARMEPDRKYPVIFYVYSGPSAPVVANSWERDLFWNNLLLENGYIVVSCDNRSATAISKTLENTILKRLSGEGEVNDLVDAVRWVKAQPYVDSSRVGIWGWSGGGSCTLNGMTRSTEFKAGIDVAGVTDFRYYDSRFAEQWMKTEAENKAGLEENALVNHAKDLHGRLLMVHGTYDDNVHIQNTWAFVNALIKADKLVEMMIYPMRQHGISDLPARIHLYNTMLDFWKRNL